MTPAERTRTRKRLTQQAALQRHLHRLACEIQTLQTDVAEGVWKLVTLSDSQQERLLTAEAYLRAIEKELAQEAEATRLASLQRSVTVKAPWTDGQPDINVQVLLIDWPNQPVTQVYRRNDPPFDPLGSHLGNIARLGSHRWAAVVPERKLSMYWPTRKKAILWLIAVNAFGQCCGSDQPETSS